MYNGHVIDIPQGDLTPKQTQALLLKLRRSEVINAKAVRAAQAYIKKLQQQYGKKK